MLTIKVNGYRQAKEILDGLPNGMQKSILLAALRQSARPMLTSARSKIPVRSGKLKRQLRIVRFRDRNAPKSEVAVAVKPVFERSKKSGVVNQYYGKFIHEGTADPRTSKKGKLLVFDDAQGKKVFVRSVYPADALFGAGLHGELRTHGGDLRRRAGRCRRTLHSETL